MIRAAQKTSENPAPARADGQIDSRLDQLFMALAEELKLPLQHIARQAELQQLQAGHNLVAESAAAMLDIQASADMTLQLLDSYLLSLRVATQPEAALRLEPVSVSSVLYDTANDLRHIAGQYGVNLQVHIQGRYEPVLANRQALHSALMALGHAVIEALPTAGAGRRYVQLATHRSRHGLVAGVYGAFNELTPQLYQHSQQLHGRVRQPLVTALPGSGAGVYVADALLAAMASRLRVGRFMKLPGFAVTLPISEQLQLI